MSILQSRVDLTVGEGGNIGNLGVLQRPRSFSASRTFPIFLVGRKVKGDEKEEVRANYSHACKSCELLSGAFPRVWHPLEVGRGKVGVGCEVDKPCKKTISIRS